MADFIFRCDVSKQYKRYRNEIDRALIKVLGSGVYILGEEVKKFEKEFAGYIGRAYGISVGSGTDALILALKAAGIKKGDKVITSTYAPAPVPTAIVLAGGKPVFSDIEEDTCLISPNEIEKKISRKTRFILPVHIFGSVCNIAAINNIARKNNLLVIEDAAQAHGSFFGGKKAGSFGDLSCFSFYPTKNLGCYGDGGMILTDSKITADKLRLLRNYGKKYNPFDSEMIGYNSRLDEIQASILRVKLRYLDKMNKERLKLVNLYKEGLRGLPLIFLKEYENAKSNNHIMAILCREKRDGLMKFLKRRGIQTNVYYPKPLHMMRAFKRYLNPNDKFPVSERISKEAMALPLYPELKKEDVWFVINTIREYF